MVIIIMLSTSDGDEDTNSVDKYSEDILLNEKHIIFIKQSLLPLEFTGSTLNNAYLNNIFVYTDNLGNLQMFNQISLNKNKMNYIDSNKTQQDINIDGNNMNLHEKYDTYDLLRLL